MSKEDFVSTKIKFYISSAGLAGDPQKLLYGLDTKTGYKYYELFNENRMWSLKRAKKRILKKAKAMKSEYIGM